MLTHQGPLCKKHDFYLSFCTVRLVLASLWEVLCFLSQVRSIHHSTVWHGLPYDQWHLSVRERACLASVTTKQIRSPVATAVFNLTGLRVNFLFQTQCHSTALLQLTLTLKKETMNSTANKAPAIGSSPASLPTIWSFRSQLPSCITFGFHLVIFFKEFSLLTSTRWSRLSLLFSCHESQGKKQQMPKLL